MIIQIILIFLLFSHAAQAAPTISGSSGSVTNGSALTISGSNLIAWDKTNWDSYFTTNANSFSFEGSNPSADGYCGQGPCGGSYDSTFKIHGSKSIKFEINHTPPPVCAAPTPCTSYNGVPNSSGQDVWFHAYIAMQLNSGCWPDSFLKQFYDLNNYYVDLGWDATCTYSDYWSFKYGNPHSEVNNPTGQFQPQRWYDFMGHWKSSSPRLNEYWVEGQQLLSLDPGITDSINTILIGMVNIGASQAVDITTWMDAFSWGSTQIYGPTVEINTSSICGAGTVVRQELTNISDSAIAIKVSLPAGGGPYWTCVKDSNQVYSNAFSLSGGSSGGALSVRGARMKGLRGR